MAILFAISLLSFCALLWAAFSIARHIRKSHSPANPVASTAPAGTPSTTSPRQHPAEERRTPSSRSVPKQI